MNRQVPRNRATRSDIRPRVSESYRGSGIPGRTSRGWSIRCRGRRSRATGGLPGRALAPVLRQQVVEDVVDGDRTEQVVGVVDDRYGDQVVGSQVGGDLGQRAVRAERVDVV